MKNHLWFIFCVLILLVKCSFSAERCTNKGVLIKRNFYVGEHNLTFKIEVSKRISHQLVSNIARTILVEALGYQNVILVPQETDDTVRTLQTISSCEYPDPGKCKDEKAKGPDVMINLELWLQPGFNLEKWTTTDRIEDCGPLGPVGRAGWFIANHTIDRLKKENGTDIDYYSAFLNPEVTAIFDLSSDLSVIERANKTCHLLNDTEEYDCGSDGFYRPPQCRNKTVRCATILSDYPQSSFTSLSRVILDYKLLVNIAWLGNDFEDTLIKMIGDTNVPGTRNLLFYHKKPMIYSKTFSHVRFPDCEDGLRKCEFEVNQLQKVVWSEIKTSTPHAFHVLRNMSFTQDQYSQLLDSYYKGSKRGFEIESFACEWLKDNEYLWTSWVPMDAEKKMTLYIGGIFPTTGVYWKQNAVVEAAIMASEAINTNETLLKNYNLVILEKDGHCATDEVMTSYIEYVKSDIYKRTVGILGPACSDTVEPIAGVASHFSTVIISYSAEGILFNHHDKEEKYRFFFRTIPENNLFRYVFIKFFENYKHLKVAALTEEGQKYPEYLSYLQELMEEHKMTFIENRKFPRERAFTNMSVYLEDLNKKNARIIIGDFYEYAARSVMCSAYKMGMTAADGYFWFLPSWFPENWYDTDRTNRENYETEHVPCSTEEMIEAINGHMSLSHKFFADDDCIMQQSISVKQWKELYRQSLMEDNLEPSSYAGYAYDAVWAYALALDRLFEENESHVATLHSQRTSRRFVELLRDTDFNGVSGHLSFQNGSRVSDVIIWQWINESRSTIGIYRASSPDDGVLELNVSNIKFLDSRKPEDGLKEIEDCAVEGLRKFLGGVKCDIAKVFANVFGIFSFIAIVIVGIVVYKRRYDKRLKSTEKRMQELGLLTNGVPYSLDEWELPRDRIVINRKLGEGAFGTVYGGEALVGNKGWVAVAVKTLKKHSKIEEKLDFLGEAEIMKQFDHVNIVKLVGVCTTEEPVYTVMEFMLYGDLKTYLLSRRHMASEVDRWKNEEVSDRRLTNMALDIARGLSYLADKKYVHRDLACRNCLINTSRSVKIADFGMCRAMYDSDYYRYNKKGMLPIRWMARESLIDGLFTTMSDVWSYGVVLYEIISFASHPYQGFSHEQVIEHVKSHKTLPVPKGCKPALEALLKQCWSSDPTARPQAAAIVEILALDPELITPCLDVPATSVALEETDDDDGRLSTMNLIQEETDAPNAKALGRAQDSCFSSVWQRRKSAATRDPTQLGNFDTSQCLQNGLETVQCVEHSGVRHPNKKCLHGSFKKAKRDLCEDRIWDNPYQTTHM